ncbi:hypothetical protein B9Z55_001241 [Caenorhabditis nigoni]|uniref:Uncharacterized protein n=1 Tax=Caenorhabditis nigoni TaxID=1611254 RepID=A0A2G5VEW2_9PELO|nr:hypothetical protein B9Z55_001241 [Caenorhabditis nigoni]
MLMGSSKIFQKKFFQHFFCFFSFFVDLKHIVRCAIASSKNGDSMPGVQAVMWTVALRNVTDQFNIASTGKFMESVNYLGAKD